MDNIPMERVFIRDSGGENNPSQVERFFVQRSTAHESDATLHDSHSLACSFYRSVVHILLFDSVISRGIDLFFECNGSPSFSIMFCAYFIMECDS